MSFKIADGYVEVHARHDRDSTRRNARQAADDADREFQKREGSALKWLFKPNPKLMKMLEAPIGSIFSSPIIFASAALLATGLAGFLSTAIVSALTVGVVGAFAAIAIMVNKKALEAPWNKMVQRVESVFTRASKPLMKPFVGAIDMIGDAAERAEPILTRIYAAIAPLVEPFTGGILGFIEAMLPGIERAMPGFQVVMLSLAEHLPGLGTAIGDMFATIAENGPLLARVVGLMITWLENFFKVAGPILVFWMEGFAFWADSWAEMIDRIKLGMKWLEETWKKIPGWWNASWGAVKGWFSDMGASIGGFFTDLGSSISNWWNDQTSSLSGWWASTWGAVTTWFSELPGKIGGFFAAIPGAIIGWIQYAFDTSTYMIGYAIGTWVSLMASLPGKILGVLAAGWVLIGDWANKALSWLTNRFAEAWATVVLRVLWLRDELPRILLEMMTALGLHVVNGLRTIYRFFDELPTRLGNTARNAWNSVYDWFSNARSRLTDTSWDIVNRIVVAVANLQGRLFQAGRDAIYGLVNGIQSLLGWAIDAAWRAARNIAQGFIDALWIGSPSKYMAEKVGKWIPKGIVVGVEDNMGELDDIAARIPETFTGGMGTGGMGTTTDQSTNYGNITVEVHVDNLQELADIEAFLNGTLRNSTKARNWSGNIYEAQGEYQRSYS